MVELPSFLVKYLDQKMLAELAKKGAHFLCGDDGEAIGALVPVERYRTLCAIEDLVSNRDRLKQLIEDVEKLEAGEMVLGSGPLDELVKKLQSQK